MGAVGAIILAHLVGDYLIQTDWMANEKTSRWWPAIIHGATYALPFLVITQSPWALLAIAGTHMVIDRYRLAKYFVWARSQIGPKSYRPAWPPTATGMRESAPIWLSTWLLFIADNTIHLLINVAAVNWL